MTCNRPFVAVLALAAAAAAMPLSAQAQAPVTATSQVQLYGRVDLGVRHDTTRDPATGRKYGTRLDTATNNSVGIQGREDLGGGLQAYFQLEHRFRADTGSVADPSSFWNEISVLGLRGSWGALQVGRQDGPIFYGLSPDAFYGDYVGGRGERKAGADDKFNNGLMYFSPLWGGTQLIIGTVAERPVAADGREMDRARAAALVYRAGPLMVSGAVSHRFNGDLAWGVGSTYYLGDVQLLFVAGRNDGKGMAGLTDGKRTTLDVGTIVPVGPGTLRAKYNHDKRETATTRNYGLGYLYDLSKRTNLYLTGSHTRITRQGSSTAFDLGIVHRF